jgi:hypothetical protein
MATASATERFHSLKPKNLKGDKTAYKGFFLWTALPFMTCQTQPLATISTAKTVDESFPLYFEFLNITAATWIYVFSTSSKGGHAFEGIESRSKRELKVKYRSGSLPTTRPQRQKCQLHFLTKRAVLTT